MKSLLSIFLVMPLLASCATVQSGPLSLPLQERLRNPLVAERYWSGLAEHMADFVRTKDPILKDSVKASVIDAERLRALERVHQARALKKEGMSGIFQSIHPGEDAFGEALLRTDTLYFGTTFEIKPNPSVQVFLTTMLDPRDGPFPDKTSLNLGTLQTAFGAQEYEIPEAKMNPKFQTVVLYDTRLERMIGFAQLSK